MMHRLIAFTMLAVMAHSDLEELARQSLATIDGHITMRGLRDSAQVIRDRWGVPHIYARNIDDLFFAQGFVQAQDRLWQMEVQRRVAASRQLTHAHSASELPASNGLVRFAQQASDESSCRFPRATPTKSGGCGGVYAPSSTTASVSD